MKTQGVIVTSEISQFRKQAEELLQLVDTLKEDNTRKLYDLFLDERDQRRKVDRK